MRAAVLAAVTGLSMFGMAGNAAPNCGTLHIIDMTIDADSGTNGVDAKTEPVCAGDTIVWNIHNTTDGRVKLKLKDFKNKETSDPKRPEFHGSDEVTIEPGYRGALLAHLPTTLLRPGDGAITIKYATVLKRSGRPDKVKDPELLMEPPPTIVPPKGRGRGRGGV